MAASLSGQSNPFISSPGGVEITESGETTSAGFAARTTASLQRSYQAAIARAMEGLRHGEGVGSLFTLLLVSFVFGFLHAAGPGHRKGILVSFFLGEGFTPGKGILAGFLLAAIHSLTAILLVGGIYAFTARPLLSTVDGTQSALYIVTWVVILLLGVWMAAHGLGKRSGKGQDGKGIGFWGLVLSGAVPCPGASAIMIMAVVEGAFFVGVLSVVSMSAGMGTLLAITGLVTVLSRNRAASLLKDPARGRVLETVLHLLSGIAMILFAVVMLSGYL